MVPRREQHMVYINRCDDVSYHASASQSVHLETPLSSPSAGHHNYSIAPI
jgi:hypothetical protein